ncbi:unnamed protein product [Prunus brigantina]
MENIHSGRALNMMYSLLLETYFKDSREKHRLFNEIESIPCVSRKAKWALDWIHGYMYILLLHSWYEQRWYIFGFGVLCNF